jgi:hypothetical protein
MLAKSLMLMISTISVPVPLELGLITVQEGARILQWRAAEDEPLGGSAPVLR